jgi:hypothetical protein
MKVDYWDYKSDREVFFYTTEDDAIEAFLDEASGSSCQPETLTLHGYSRVKITGVNVDSPLEYVIERLDDEYGNPDSDGTDITPAMEQAEQIFIDAILEEYVPWTCEHVVEKQINIKEWLDAKK